jgi:hypothetical protein
MSGGRPSKYNSEEHGGDTVARVKEYMADCPDVLPSIAGLACYLKISRETIHQWKKDEEKPAFSDILGTLLAEQERQCVNGALGGDYNATIAKLLLGKHGYSDKSEQEVSGPNGGPVQVNQWNLTGVSPKSD